VEANWLGAPFTPSQLSEAFAVTETEIAYLAGKPLADAFGRANPPGAYNAFEHLAFTPESTVNLLRRAFAIQNDLDRTASQDPRLEGALSAVGLVLAIVDPYASNVIPYAGRYLGSGNNPAAALQAALQDVINPAPEAPAP
jgi:hypothetical protein